MEPFNQHRGQAMGKMKVSGNSSFTVEDVQSIRRCLALGDTTRRQVARDWGVALDTINKIARRDTFDWVPVDWQPGDPVPLVPASRAVQAVREGAQKQEGDLRAEAEASLERVKALLNKGQS